MRRLVVGEGLEDPVPQLVGVELAGVDEEVGPLADRPSSLRSSAIDSSTPRAASGWRRRVPS